MTKFSYSTTRATFNYLLSATANHLDTTPISKSLGRFG
ncbi:hypothetical protein B4168_0112 [Anoxybacillus flavithermus]|nr:hypothetical protein B4168_0112 [Anoxybacillus flavithermus]OAO88965.1 hypothetical protein GT23_0205 [Parageobacillus thermoglucosidasius]